MEKKERCIPCVEKALRAKLTASRKLNATYAQQIRSLQAQVERLLYDRDST